jgi:hypothetical protein
MLTGFTPPGKYGPEGDAMTQIINLFGCSNAEEWFRGEHEWTHVQGVFTPCRHPLDILLHQRCHGAEEVVDT